MVQETRGGGGGKVLKGRKESKRGQGSLINIVKVLLSDPTDCCLQEQRQRERKIRDRRRVKVTMCESETEGERWKK